MIYFQRKGRDRVLIPCPSIFFTGRETSEIRLLNGYMQMSCHAADRPTVSLSMGESIVFN